MTKFERVCKKINKDRLIKASIINGIVTANANGYKKPYDIALCIQMQLEFNFNINNAKDPLTPLDKSDEYMDNMLKRYAEEIEKR